MIPDQRSCPTTDEKVPEVVVPPLRSVSTTGLTVESFGTVPSPFDTVPDTRCR